MATPWFRLWADMVNDPKWRTIARVSKQEISRVISVYMHMMTCASNAADRGHTEGWCDEDVATALDIDTNDVVAIREAMQGRVLDGDYLTGWEKRQPKREREDFSTERVREFRGKQNHETPRNADDNHETPRVDKEVDKEEIKSNSKTTPDGDLFGDVSPQVVADFKAMRKTQKAAVTKTVIAGIQREATKAGLTLEAALSMCCERSWRGFKAEWISQPVRGSPAYESAKDKSRREASEKLTGRTSNDNRIIDIN